MFFPWVKIWFHYSYGYKRVYIITMLPNVALVFLSYSRILNARTSKRRTSYYAPSSSLRPGARIAGRRGILHDSNFQFLDRCLTKKKHSFQWWIKKGCLNREKSASDERVNPLLPLKADVPSLECAKMPLEVEEGAKKVNSRLNACWVASRCEAAYVSPKIWYNSTQGYFQKNEEVQ